MPFLAKLFIVFSAEFANIAGAPKILARLFFFQNWVRARNDVGGWGRGGV